jgi:hypothetical protein
MSIGDTCTWRVLYVAELENQNLSPKPVPVSRTSILCCRFLTIFWNLYRTSCVQKSWFEKLQLFQKRKKNTSEREFSQGGNVSTRFCTGVILFARANVAAWNLSAWNTASRVYGDARYCPRAIFDRVHLGPCALIRVHFGPREVYSGEDILEPLVVSMGRGQTAVNSPPNTKTMWRLTLCLAGLEGEQAHHCVRQMKSRLLLSPAHCHQCRLVSRLLFSVFISIVCATRETLRWAMERID